MGQWKSNSPIGWQAEIILDPINVKIPNTVYDSENQLALLAIVIHAVSDYKNQLYKN